jgi:glutamine amidotransferase
MNIHTHTVGVIDYKAGNAPSVLNALRHLNIPAEYVTDKAGIQSTGMLILPGVGSAAATMESLDELNLLDALDERVNRQGVPFLGICIGLQILFSHSEEGNADCLGWIPGKVKRFPESAGRIPQMGWNRVEFTDNRPASYFYFVNSYHAVPDDPSVVFAHADYGLRFCAMVKRGNIAAAQFHLEKSGEAGLKLLAEWAEKGTL